MSRNNLSEIASILLSNLILGYCGMAARVILVYDQLITLPLEMDVMWGRRLSIVTFLYHLNRWSAFVWAMFNVAHLRIRPDALIRCSSLTYFDTAIIIVLGFISAAVLSIRTLTIRGNWFMTLVVLLLSAMPIGTNVYATYVSTRFQVDMLPTNDPVCASESTATASVNLGLVNATLVSIIVANLLVSLATWYQTYTMKREASRSGLEIPLATLLNKDGSVFFLIGVGVNTVGLIVRDTNAFAFASTTFLPALSSLMISHFLLSLREVTQQHNQDDQLPDFVIKRDSKIPGKFSYFLDNLGERLRDEPLPDPDMLWEDVMASELSASDIESGRGNGGNDAEKATQDDITELAP